MKTELKIDWATHAAAKHAVENWHYSHSMPVGKTVKIGAWENGKFIGVVIFAYGANNNIGKPFGLEQTQCCELVRIALTMHTTPVSRVAAIAMRFLKSQSPGIKLVVSYADTAQGHHGGIYQAGNWTFCGTSKGASQYVLNGRIVHSMQIQTFIRAGKIKSRKGLQVVKAGDKHKYLMPLDNEMKKRILPLAKPYPKRAGSDTSDTPGFHPGKGGSLPTPALHSQSGGEA